MVAEEEEEEKLLTVLPTEAEDAEEKDEAETDAARLTWQRKSSVPSMAYTGGVILMRSSESGMHTSGHVKSKADTGD